MAKMRASPALGPLWEGAVGKADWGREILMPSLPPSPCGRHLPHRGRQRDADCHDQSADWSRNDNAGANGFVHPCVGNTYFLKLSFKETLRLNTMWSAALSRLSRQK